MVKDQVKTEAAVGEDAEALIVVQTVEVAVAEVVAPSTIYHIVRRKATLAEAASEVAVVAVAVVVVEEVDTSIKVPLSSRMRFPSGYSVVRVNSRTLI